MSSAGTMPKEYYFLGYVIARLTPSKGKWDVLGHRYLTGFVRHCIRGIPSLNSHYFEKIGVESEKDIDERAYKSLKGLRDEFWGSGVEQPPGYSDTKWGNETADYHTKQINIWKNKSDTLVKEAVHALFSSKKITETDLHLLPEGLPPKGETLFTKSRDPSGWIYVITNPIWGSWVKIGVTRNLKKRLSSYNTSSPHKDFFIEWFKFHENARELETFIHNDDVLGRHRGLSKEWYNLKPQDSMQHLGRVFRDFRD